MLGLQLFYAKINIYYRRSGLYMHIFRKAQVSDYLKADAHLNKSLTAPDLLALGIGAVIGTGIFILPGTVAAQKAGPGISLSFLLAAGVCVLAAMCYAEFAAAIPVAGSAYSYGNIIYGEFTGWLLGWALVLEYMLAVSAVAAGWSAYFSALIRGYGLKIPQAVSGPLNPAHGVYIDLVAILIIALITTLLLQGMRDSVRVNNLMVIVKIAIILTFIFAGMHFIKPGNYHPFLPYHFAGVIKGAATVFFAFLGFDVVSASAAEVKKPQKNLPLGIIGTLAVAAVLYIGVSIVLTGMIKYNRLDVANPVAFALYQVHQKWLAELLSVGALIGMATMMLTMIYSSSRLIYAMSRDGLLPAKLSQLDLKHHAPQHALVFVSFIIAVAAGFLSVDQLTNMVNFGTLFAFLLVSWGILRLRKREDIPNTGFKVPGYPVLPIISSAVCLYLLTQLSLNVYILVAIWFALGIIIYFFYGYQHSKLNK